MDTTEFAEGQYITAELVSKSPSKICVVMEEAKAKETEYGQALSVAVEIDQKSKTWRLNRDSVKNMQQLGVDSKLWLGKKVRLMTVNLKGKETVIGVPIMD